MGLISRVPAVDASGGWIETRMGDTVKVDLVDKVDTVDGSGRSRCNVAEGREVHYVHSRPLTPTRHSRLLALPLPRRFDWLRIQRPAPKAIRALVTGGTICNGYRKGTTGIAFVSFLDILRGGFRRTDDRRFLEVALAG